MKTPRPSWIIVALVAGLAFSGCGSKKKLDQTVDLLRVAAEGNQYAAFQALAHPELAKQFPPPQLARVSKALARLGAFKERTMKGISVKGGGRREANYTLTYEKGSVELELAIVGEKIVKFNFSGDALKKALEAERAARFAKFEVGHFVFLERPGGKDKRNNIFKLGDAIPFRLRVHGLKLVEGKVFFSSDLMVKADSETVLSKPNFAGLAEPLPTKGLPVGTFTGTIRLPRPGTYIAMFTIHDKHAKKSLQYMQAIVVQP